MNRTFTDEAQILNICQVNRGSNANAERVAEEI